MTLQLPLPFELRDDHKLSSFVHGSNTTLVEALCGLASVGGEGQMLWIQGGAGSGKTHLLQAVVGHYSDQAVEVAYLPATQITGEHAASMLEGAQRYRVLVIDDVDCWLGQRLAEVELVRLYQERRHAGNHLLLSATLPPTGYKMALPDWQSRARGAVLYTLHELSDEDKLEVLMARADRLGLELGDSVATYLLRHGPRGLPQMIEILARVDRLALAEQRRLTVPLLKKVLHNASANPEDITGTLS